MKRLAALSILALSVLLVAATVRPQAPPRSGPGQAGPAQTGAPLVFRNQIVFDQGLNLEYSRMLVPKDWAFQGGSCGTPRRTRPKPRRSIR